MQQNVGLINDEADVSAEQIIVLQTIICPTCLLPSPWIVCLSSEIRAVKVVDSLHVIRLIDSLSDWPVGCVGSVCSTGQEADSQLWSKLHDPLERFGSRSRVSCSHVELQWTGPFHRRPSSLDVEPLRRPRWFPGSRSRRQRNLLGWRSHRRIYLPVLQQQWRQQIDHRWPLLLGRLRRWLEHLPRHTHAHCLFHTARPHGAKILDLCSSHFRFMRRSLLVGRQLRKCPISRIPCRMLIKVPQDGFGRTQSHILLLCLRRRSLSQPRIIRLTSSRGWRLDRWLRTKSLSFRFIRLQIYPLFR